MVYHTGGMTVNDARAALLAENDGEPYECAVCHSKVQMTEGIVRQLKADEEAWLACLECREKMITVIREKLSGKRTGN